MESVDVATAAYLGKEAMGISTPNPVLFPVAIRICKMYVKQSFQYLSHSNLYILKKKKHTPTLTAFISHDTIF